MYTNSAAWCVLMLAVCARHSFSAFYRQYMHAYITYIAHTCMHAESGINTLLFFMYKLNCNQPQINALVHTTRARPTPLNPRCALLTVVRTTADMIKKTLQHLSVGFLS